MVCAHQSGLTAELVDVAVHDPSWAVRYTALQSLRKAKAPGAAVDLLRKGLSDPDLFVRREVGDLLRAWKRPPSPTPCAGRHGISRRCQ